MINLKNILFLGIIFIYKIANAQYSVSELYKLPEAISNNAVTGYLDDTEKFVYSFGGIDSTKSYSGIHNRCYKYNAAFDTWIQMPDLPQSPTRIAAGASTINDTIYIIGGYHVASNGSETSSNLVHRFQVMADTFLANGTPLPKPIDDHVQAVYKDSLIFIITGWSQTSNQPDVQIYNPKLDSWLIGSSVPNTHEYKSFGASGSIVGDTIYYFGGARMGGNFPIQNQLRKGYINPNNVTDITWSLDTINVDLVGYRMAASAYDNSIRWVGGSNATYNYNGIGYAGNLPVEPNRRILTYYPLSNSWDTVSFPEINMDFRGVATFGCQMILVGGMDANQKVSKRTLKIDCNPNSVQESVIQNSIRIWPNPASSTVKITGVENHTEITIYSVLGKVVLHQEMNRNAINVSNFSNGLYFLKVGTSSTKKLIIRH